MVQGESAVNFGSNQQDEEINSENSADEEQHIFSVSPDELLDFMLKRAQKNPQAFVILLDLRFNEIIFMLLRAESNSNASLYCAALRYAMLLTVNTNAHHYVEMM